MNSKDIWPNIMKATLSNTVLYCSLVIVLAINILAYFQMHTIEYAHDMRVAIYFVLTVDLLTVTYLVVYYLLVRAQVAKINRLEHEKYIFEKTFRDVIEDSHDLICVVDKNFKYILFNTSYQNEIKKLFLKTINIGMSLNETFSDSPEYCEKILKTYQRSMSGEKFQEVLEVNDGTYEIISSPIKDESNNIVGVIHVNRNITRRIQQDLATRELNEKLAYEMQEIGIHNEKMKLLIELTDIVQACVSVKEATKAISAKCRKILHFAEGSLYIMDPTKNILELVTTWGDPIEHTEAIMPDQCWALRKGGIYQVKNPQSDLICDHIHEKTASPYMCVPLMAQNAIFGLLHLDFTTNSSLSEENRLLISAVTETLSLALANINLRATLRDQSLHDSLTGLYNRRYMEEFLNKEATYAERRKAQFAIIMLDIDNFKEFNDTLGHEAGNVLLRELGSFFQNEIRTSDFVCRYGGEEFLCLLHDCDLQSAKQRAEQIRIKISKLSIPLANHQIESVTVSLGLSIYPDDGLTMSDLIEAADKALYQAKNTNKNKVIAYSEMGRVHHN